MTPQWNHPGFDLPTVAEAVGPFSSADFLAAVAPHDRGELWLASSDQAFMALRRIDGEVRFAGEAELSDYHTPRGDRSDLLVAEITGDQSLTKMVLDSLPEEAAKPLASGLEQAGWSVEVRIHEVAAVLELPSTVDAFLQAIGKKERHELRRKRRRYERMVGPVVHETHRGLGWAFDEFVRLHRLAEGEKGGFLTREVRDLFNTLAQIEGWRFDLLHTEHDTAAAVVFGFSDHTGYYLYNSAYDPVFSDASPGVVLLGTMIEQAIEEDSPLFDFLKGDEPYKFRLGARERPLTEIVAVPGRRP